MSTLFTSLFEHRTPSLFPLRLRLSKGQTLFSLQNHVKCTLISRRQRSGSRCLCRLTPETARGFPQFFLSLSWGFRKTKVSSPRLAGNESGNRHNEVLRVPLLKCSAVEEHFSARPLQSHASSRCGPPTVLLEGLEDSRSTGTPQGTSPSEPPEKERPSSTSDPRRNRSN